MRFVDQMKEWQQKFESDGYEVYVPTLFDFHKVRDEYGNLEKFEEIKRRETKKHLKRLDLQVLY